MIPPKTRSIVLERDGGRCVIRGPHCTGRATLADHRANRGSGGSSLLDTPECLIAACELCNGWKEDAVGAAREDLIRNGIRVLKASTNTLTVLRCMETPVLYPDGWYVLVGAERQRMLPAEVAEYLAFVSMEEAAR